MNIAVAGGRGQPDSRRLRSRLPHILAHGFSGVRAGVGERLSRFSRRCISSAARIPGDAIYTLQHFMNNKFAKLDYQDVTTAAYSFAVLVLALFGVLYRAKAVRSGEEYGMRQQNDAACPPRIGITGRGHFALRCCS